MKKFTKLFLSCAAVTAVTAAIATSAMAADVTGDLAGTYNEETGKLSLTTEFTGTTTVLVLAPTADTTAVDADDIVYINQVENGVLGEMGVKGAPTAETGAGKYTVLVGSYVEGEFKVTTGAFKLGGSSVINGDADLSEEVDIMDALKVAQYTVDLATLVDDALYAADADLSEEVDIMDALAIAQYTVDLADPAFKIGEAK